MGKSKDKSLQNYLKNFSKLGNMSVAVTTETNIKTNNEKRSSRKCLAEEGDDMCECTSCIKEKICEISSNSIFIDTITSEVHDWSAEAMNDNSLMSELKSTNRHISDTFENSDEQEMDKKQKSRYRKERSEVSATREHGRPKKKRTNRAKKRIEYSKWDRLCADLSDSDIGSVPSIFDDLKYSTTHDIEFRKMRGPNGRTGYAIKKTLKRVIDPSELTDRAESMSRRTRRKKADKRSRSPVMENLAPLQSRITWNFSIEAKVFDRRSVKPIYSPIEVDKHGFNWRLVFYPVALKEQEHLSVFLEVPESDKLPFGWHRKVKFVITLVNKTLSKLLESIDEEDRKRVLPENTITSKTRPDCHLFRNLNGDSSWGWPKFIEIDQFAVPEKTSKLELEIHADIKVLYHGNEPRSNDVLPYLVDACMNSSLRDVKRCIALQKKYNLSIVNEILVDHAALHAVCIAEETDLDIAEYLLQQGAEVNKVNSEKESPLMLASFYGKYELVQLLLNYGADVEVGPSVNGLCSIGAAAQTGRCKVLKTLLKSKATAVDGLEHGCCVPLKQALQMHHWDCAAALIKMGADVCGEDADEYILFLAKNGPADCKLLFNIVENGCPLNVLDKDGDCPLGLILFERKLNEIAYRLWSEYGASLKLVEPRKKQQRARMLLQLEGKKLEKKREKCKIEETQKLLMAETENENENIPLEVLMSKLSSMKVKSEVKHQILNEFKNVQASIEMVSPSGSDSEARKSLVLTSNSPRAISAAVGSLAEFFNQLDDEKDTQKKTGKLTKAKRQAIISELKKTMKVGSKKGSDRIRMSLEEFAEADDETFDLFMNEQMKNFKETEKRLMKRSTDYLKAIKEKEAYQKELELKEKKADEIALQLLKEEELAVQKKEASKKKKKKKRKKKKQKQKEINKTDDTSTSLSEDTKKPVLQQNSNPAGVDEMVTFESAVAQFKAEEIAIQEKQEPIIKPPKMPEPQETKFEEVSQLESDNIFDMDYASAETDYGFKDENNEVVQISADDILKNLLLLQDGFIDFTDHGINKLFSNVGALEEQVLLSAMSEHGEGLRGVIEASEDIELITDPLTKAEFLKLKSARIYQKPITAPSTPKVDSLFAPFDFSTPKSKTGDISQKASSQDSLIFPDFSSFEMNSWEEPSFSGLPAQRSRELNVEHVNPDTRSDKNHSSRAQDERKQPNGYNFNPNFQDFVPRVREGSYWYNINN